jgi:hypothetical protein
LFQLLSDRFEQPPSFFFNGGSNKREVAVILWALAPFLH